MKLGRYGKERLEKERKLRNHQYSFFRPNGSSLRIIVEEIDSGKDFEEELLDYLNKYNADESLMIDMSKIRQIDASFPAVILAINRTLEKRNKKLRLTGLKENTQPLYFLKLYRLEQLIYQPV